MNKVFVDTWAWYALADATDAEHARAQATNDRLLNEGDVFVTTNFVLAEAITLIRYHLHHAAAVRFHQLLQQMVAGGLVEVVRISEEHEASAWAIFEKYSDQKFSYTDCTSFAVMQELHLTDVFTGDHHFSILGFMPIS
jgi:predicted nucleic acid-binding protein